MGGPFPRWYASHTPRSPPPPFLPEPSDLTGLWRSIIAVATATAALSLTAAPRRQHPPLRKAATPLTSTQTPLPIDTPHPSFLPPPPPLPPGPHSDGSPLPPQNPITYPPTHTHSSPPCIPPSVSPHHSESFLSARPVGALSGFRRLRCRSAPRRSRDSAPGLVSTGDGPPVPAAHCLPRSRRCRPHGDRGPLFTPRPPLPRSPVWEPVGTKSGPRSPRGRRWGEREGGGGVLCPGAQPVAAI